VDEINIWEDPDGAAFVRSVAGGNETVPTVRIGTRSVVNPSPRDLLELIRERSE
jgi:mycoredoxin